MELSPYVWGEVAFEGILQGVTIMYMGVCVTLASYTENYNEQCK